jgi:hypothetical protein
MKSSHYIQVAPGEVMADLTSAYGLTVGQLWLDILERDIQQ